MTKRERHINLPKTSQEAIKTLERFVIRARRIEAHSLVKSQKIKELAQPNYTMHFNDSSVSLRLNSRPEDEEVFESLAARIRPCIVDSEPIQLEKVVAAIRILTSGITLSEKQFKLLDDVNVWCKKHIAPHSYAPISSHEEIEKLDSDNIALASDTLLGLGWYYADLVHADPKQEKEVALEFPYDFRYNQGVLLVSYLTLIICSLLNLIRDINDAHNLGLSPSIWTSQVTAGGGPFEYGIGEVYIGPAGSVPPAGVPIENIREFKKLDLITARRMQCPSQTVDAQLVDTFDNVLDIYEGFYFIDKALNRVVININNEILLSGEPKENASPVEELPFEQAFFSKCVSPVGNKREQFEDFLNKVKDTGRLDISMSWRGIPIRGTISFPEVPQTGSKQPTND